MYSVTINLNEVRDVDDLILQLVRIQSVFNQEIDWLAKLSKRNKPYPLDYRGVRRYGNIFVRDVIDA